MVEREAYSHEVISFGFWWGDDRIPAPAFYSYTVPEPSDLTGKPLRPEVATWEESGGGHLAILMYDDARQSQEPRKVILDFLESAYLAGADAADWPIEDLALRPLGK
jgi:hypothetical protein